MHETHARITPLIDQLNRVGCHYAYEKGYIGEAISMLRLLKDILEKQEVLKRS